jgi:hypothetical protein
MRRMALRELSNYPDSLPVAPLFLPPSFVLA